MRWLSDIRQNRDSSLKTIRCNAAILYSPPRATSLQTEITMWCGRLDSSPEWQECNSIYYSLDYKQKWCQIRADLTIKRFFLSIISISRFSLSISGLIPAFVACICALIYLLLQTMFNSCINMIRISIIFRHDQETFNGTSVFKSLELIILIFDLFSKHT